MRGAAPPLPARSETVPPPPASRGPPSMELPAAVTSPPPGLGRQVAGSPHPLLRPHSPEQHSALGHGAAQPVCRMSEHRGL